MAFDGGARRDRGLDRARVGGVEITDEMIDVQTELGRDAQSRVGRDHVRVAG